MKIAELICHQCGAVSYTRLPTYRNSTMPRCGCGGMKQVVRVVTKRTPITLQPEAPTESRQDPALG